MLGVDISLARVARRSLREMPNNVQFQEMNATHLDLEGGSFDVVVSYNALGHLVGVLKDCVSEIMRTLKKGGYLIFIATWKMDRTLIPNIRSLIAIRRIMPNLQRHRKQGISHVHLEEDIMCERILRIVLHECEWNKGIL